MRDPRSSRRYIEGSQAWLAGLDVAECALCRQPVNLALPRTHPLGPTVEHTVAIRIIRATASSWADAVAMCCDSTLWAVAHKRCQDRQGAAASRRTTRRPSRTW